MEKYELTYPETDSKEYAKARYHYLLQIEFGETIAIDYSRRISLFAPTEEARLFLLKQQAEEEKHLDIMTEYIGGHARPKALISKNLKKLDQVMSDAIDEKNYVRSIFIQNFIVEGFNISMLKEIQHHADGDISELVGEILKDEIGHMQFGVDEIRRIIKENKSKKLRKELVSLQRKTLFYSTLLAADLLGDAKYLGIPVGEFVERVVNEHFDRIKEARFPLPFIDKILFKCVILFFKFRF